MPASEPFIDSSVLLYLLSVDRARADRAEELLLAGGHVSVQVLNEVAAVALRKNAMTIPEVRELLAAVHSACVAHPLTTRTHERGLEIAERYGFSLYDSMIVAAALDAGCRTLYSEDLQHGQIIEKRLKVVNPFR